ncbi:hypothetical protein FQR65_LT06872 [Abscondita terminalis]|nr:hypothetical protein FQR65_LT06872 [Abscondita terminalis]
MRFYTMKLIILVFILLADNVLSKLTIPNNLKVSWLKLVSPYYTECACTTGVRLDRAKRLFAEIELPDDPCLKCFIKCLAAKLSILIEATNEWVGAEILRKVAGMTPLSTSNCNNRTKGIEDTCEMAYQMAWCIALSVALPA